MLKSQLKDTMDVGIAVEFFAMGLNVLYHVLMDLELGWRKTSDKVIACLIGMLALGAVGRVTWGCLVLFCGRGEPFVNELDYKRLYVCW